MNKAILVMDMPRGCGYCACCGIKDYTDMHECQLKDEEVEEIVQAELRRPSWCPLKEMPNKIDVEKHREIDLLDGGILADEICKSIGEEREGNSLDIYLGWNACLNKIIGDEDETD